MRNHPHAFKNGRVFNIDTVLNEDEIEDTVIVDIAMQHDEELIAWVSWVINRNGDIFVRPSADIGKSRHHVAIWAAIDHGMQDDPTILFDGHFRERNRGRRSAKGFHDIAINANLRESGFAFHQGEAFRRDRVHLAITKCHLRSR